MNTNDYTMLDRIESSIKLQSKTCPKCKLIADNIKFIFAVAKNYEYMQSGKVEFSELASAALHGAYEAASTFDEKVKVKFISFAVWKIRRRVIEVLNTGSNNYPVRGRNAVSKLRKIKKLIESGITDFSEIAEILNISRERVAVFFSAISHNILLDSGKFNENGSYTSNHNLVASKDLLEYKDKSLVKALNRAMKRLDLKELYIVKNYYDLEGNGEMSYSEIGEVLDMTWQKVQRLLHSALKKMKLELIFEHNKRPTFKAERASFY